MAGECRIKSKDGSFIMAAQIQSLYTRNYQANIIKIVYPVCRLYKQHNETIDPFTVWFPYPDTEELQRAT